MEKIVITDREEMINTLTKVGYPIKGGKVYFWSCNRFTASFATNMMDGSLVIDGYNLLRAREKVVHGNIKIFKFYVNLSDIQFIKLIYFPEHDEDGVKKPWKGFTLLGLRNYERPIIEVKNWRIGLWKRE